MVKTEQLKAWEKRLVELLKERPDIGPKMTGQVLIHMNAGGITKVVVNKEIQE